MKTLVKRLQRGDEEAYRELYASLQKKLLYFVYRLTGNPDDTQEIVQETFERVYTRIGSLKNPGLLHNWIYRIASNLAMDRLQRRKRCSSLPLHDIDIPVDDLSEDIVIRKMDQEMIKEALMRVNEKYRVILMLHYVNGYSYREIATTLSLRTAQVRGRLYQAKQALRREIAVTADTDQGGVLR